MVKVQLDMDVLVDDFVDVIRAVVDEAFLKINLKLY